MMPVNTWGTPTVVVFDGSGYFSLKSSSEHEESTVIKPTAAKSNKNIFFIYIVFLIVCNYYCFTH